MYLLYVRVCMCATDERWLGKMQGEQNNAKYRSKSMRCVLNVHKKVLLIRSYRNIYYIALAVLTTQHTHTRLSTYHSIHTHTRGTHYIFRDYEGISMSCQSVANSITIVVNKYEPTLASTVVLATNIRMAHTSERSYCNLHSQFAKALANMDVKWKTSELKRMGSWKGGNGATNGM